ncbi:putative tRNA-dihydrouridine synthase [Anaplasma platys]|uniref:tRNA-dihydrouridine synthase n=1 Tax=Anaplasma platys TaxID=949 RepID=A0A858PY77_9RICK|nr:tRNA dihydrouridine synthase DusB [Anaplasma platys]QJC27518.1 putative tRNA-dihydrouridine synthase [Anaplasma platys]
MRQFISEYPVILAPMSGVSDLPFRSLVRKLGAGLLVSEMIASRAMILKTRQSLQKCSVCGDTSVQLAGCTPEIMAEAAKLNEDLGAKFIDLNFGCPARKVVDGYAGSALMKDEDNAARIMENVVKAVKIPVTVKMRMGWDNNNLNAPRLAKIAENVGIQMITVHGRTRNQMFTGTVNWKFVKEVKDSVKIPVIVNGDIKTSRDIVAALEESGADGVMIGRGAYGKPWIIKQALQFLKTREELPDPSQSEKLQIILEHYDSSIEHYGESLGVKIFRKHIGWYSSSHKDSSMFRAQMNMLSDHSEVRKRLTEFFTPH